MAGSAILMTIALALLVGLSLTRRSGVPPGADRCVTSLWPSALAGAAQVDVVREHRGHLLLRGVLRDGTGSHPLVHRGGVVLTGTPALGLRRGRFLQLDRKLHRGNGLPVCRGGWENKNIQASGICGTFVFSGSFLERVQSFGVNYREETQFLSFIEFTQIFSGDCH